MHRFEHQDTTQTLADGLREYYATNPSLVRGPQLSADAQEFFRCHDAVHVVYGCGTQLSHEAVVKLASLFGTTEGFSVMRGYQLHESLDIYEALKLTDILRTAFHAPIIAPRTILRCLRQKKKWPWRDFSAYDDAPLAHLREEFGIRVAGFRAAGETGVSGAHATSAG